MAIRERRKELGLSAEALARRIPVATKTLERWERGETFGHMDNLEGVAEALDTSVAELMAGPAGQIFPTTPDLLSGEGRGASPERDRTEERFDALQESIDGLAVQLAAVAAQVDVLSRRRGQSPPGEDEGSGSGT